MAIDYRTVVLILGLSHLMQVLVFYHQYKVNQFIKGPGWWLLWSAAESLGFLLILLRSNPSLLPFAITFQDPLILFGMVCIYIGIEHFFDRKINSRLVGLLYVVFLVGHLFFYYGINNIVVRTFLIDTFLVVFSVMAVLSFVRNRTRGLSSTALFNAAVLAVHALVFAFSALSLIVIRIQGLYSNGTPFPDMINAIQIFDALIVSLLWTFGFIIMVGQRLNIEATEAKNHFEQIFNTSPDAVAIARLHDSSYVDCNEGFSRITGYKKPEIIGKTPAEINLLNSLVDRLTVDRLIQDYGYCENVELFVRRKNGEQFTGLLSAKRISLMGTPHVISIMRDISARKRAEEALRVSEEQHRLLVETAQEGIVVIQEGRIVYFNPMLSLVSGYQSHDLLNRAFIDVIFPEDRELVFANYQKRLNGEAIDGHYQFRIINKNNEIRWIEISGARLEWQGKPATLNFLNDITEKKIAELELTKAKEGLEQVIHEKDCFFSIIAHDLRSPFLGFLGLTELFADEADSQSPEKLKSLGTEMNQKANNLYKLLKNLLEWSQMQQGVFTLQPKELSLNNLIADNIDLVKARSEQKGIELVNKAVHPITVYADERMINSVLLNLLSNAVKFTHRHGRITITADIQPSQSALVAVEDTGMGIHQRDLDRLFKIGEKVGAIGTDGELSTGLGLILCREFVEKHGGKIWAESHAGKGSVFSFTLPLSEPDQIPG